MPPILWSFISLGTHRQGGVCAKTACSCDLSVCAAWYLTGMFIKRCSCPQPAPAAPNAVEKKKLWDTAAPGLRTTADKKAAWKGMVMHTSAGPVTAASLVDARIA